MLNHAIFVRIFFLFFFFLLKCQHNLFIFRNLTICNFKIYIYILKEGFLLFFYLKKLVYLILEKHLMYKLTILNIKYKRVKIMWNA